MSLHSLTQSQLGLLPYLLEDIFPKKYSVCHDNRQQSNGTSLQNNKDTFLSYSVGISIDFVPLSRRLPESHNHITAVIFLHSFAKKTLNRSGTFLCCL